MARLRNFILVVLSSQAALFSWSCNCKATVEVKPEKHVALFIFGDSYVDVGNNNFINTTVDQQANFWPYGQTHFDSPTGRYSDGRVMSDFVAQYANLPLIPPFLQPGAEYHYGANFASGGGGALVETFRDDMVIDLGTQLSHFKKVQTWLTNELGVDAAETIISNAVYFFCIGINDYLGPVWTDSSVLDTYTNSQYVGMVTGNVTSVIEEIHELGGRKFAFINLPNLGCFPAVRILRPQEEDGCMEELSVLAKMHNKALFNLLVELEYKLDGFKYGLFDLHSNIEERLNLLSSTHGHETGHSACCGSGKFRADLSCGDKRGMAYEVCENPHEFVYWDSVHLTEYTNKQFADHMWGDNPSPFVLGPYTLKKLFQIDQFDG
ncbi:hypothetical protein K2173_007774 [Erythroxylum novogranatense]|uniref:Uncharacterized protein n=1 Tax=Erythroxylum novogranatense TaxID=1862640 RepID=A0AAV8TE46_9ROSI|nr:hypothetical protein K2173_007774 [Erythroxylum novogranatense]